MTTTNKPSRRIVRTAKPATQVTPVTAEAIYGPFQQIAPRAFFKCVDCGTATLKNQPAYREYLGKDVNGRHQWRDVDAKNFQRAGGRCVVCEDRMLRHEIAAPVEHEYDPTIGDDTEKAELTAMGLMTARYFDAEGNALSYEDLKSAEQFFDADGNEMTLGDLGARPSLRTTKKAQELEEAADALLQSSEDLIALGKTDPAQFILNKARLAFGLPLLAAAEKLNPKYAATANQLSTLVKLGHDRAAVRDARLTIAEASRLLQRGPTWAR